MLSFEVPDETATATPVAEEPTSASRVLELAATAAQRLLADAQTEAESVLATARAEADAIVEAGRQEAQQAATDLQRLRDLRSEQRDQLREHLTEQLARLDAALPSLPETV